VHCVTEAGLYDKRWWALLVLCMSLLVTFVGNTSLNIALPTLSRQLDATTSQLQWSVSVYSLVFSGLLFIAGALGDRFGRKGMLQLGLLGFLTGAAMATLATTMWQIIACRAVMGAAAAFIMPSTLSLLVNIFPPDERTKAIAIWAGTTGAAGGLGQLLSGWLLNHFWFGSIFLVNLPIVALTLVGSVFLVPRSRNPDIVRLDPTGAVLSVVGVSAIVYGLIEAPDSGWMSSASLTAFGVGALALLAFVRWELRVDEPMLDMRYFRNPSFSVATSGMVVVYVAIYGVMFIFTQYFQLIRGYGPLATAVRMSPIGPVMMIIAPMTPRIVRKLGANITVGIGMALVGIAYILLGQVTTTTPYAYIISVLLVQVVGAALTTSPITASIMSAVPARKAGTASAMNNTTRELGTALGVAVLGSVAASKFASGIASAIEPLSATDRSATRESLSGALAVARRLGGEQGLGLVHAANEAFVDGVRLAAVIGGGISVLAAVAVLRYLPRHLEPRGAMRGPLEAAENMAELTLGGAPPLFADTAADQVHDARRHRDHPQ
jgi:EmrB/QacA subfamily drug resistance transporter